VGGSLSEVEVREAGSQVWREVLEKEGGEQFGNEKGPFVVIFVVSCGFLLDGQGFELGVYIPQMQRQTLYRIANNKRPPLLQLFINPKTPRLHNFWKPLNQFYHHLPPALLQASHLS
jgi:hypothetical protein